MSGERSVVADAATAGRPDLGGQRADRRAWHAVWVVSFGVFCLVTSELFPVGVLPRVSADLSASTGAAGLMVTIPGLVAAVAAPLITLYARAIDRRAVLTTLVLVVAAGNLASALAPSIGVLLCARVTVGVGIGGFWALAAGLAPRLVPPNQVPQASSVIFGGVGAASVLGVPLTATVANNMGWRAGAITVAVLAVVAAIAIICAVPAMRPQPAGSPASAASTGLSGGSEDLRIAIGHTSTVLLVTLLLVVGHFAAFTFITPIMIGVSGVPDAYVPALLLAYGCAGLAGTFLAGRLVARDPRRAIQIVALGMAICTAALIVLEGRPLGAALVVLAWGVLYGAVAVTLQLWLLASSPHGADLATSAYVSVFNLSIAAGAAVGGLAIDTAASSVRTTLTVAMCLLAAAALAALLPPVLRSAKRNERN